MNHGWRWGRGLLQQGDSKSPQSAPRPRKVQTQAGRSQRSHRAARDKQDTLRGTGRTPSYPSPVPKLSAPPTLSLRSSFPGSCAS